MKSISRSNFVLGMTWLLLVVGIILLMVFNASKPRILIVHSLSRASSWTDLVDQGIKAAQIKNRMPVSVSREYLNLDLLSVDADVGALTSRMRQRIDATNPAVLVVVDDEASNLIGRHYVGRPGTSVVYTGLLGDPGYYGYAASSMVIGIRELLPLSAMATMIDHLHPGRPARIAVVGASTQTGLAEMQQVLAHHWAPHQIIASQSVPHFEAWMDFVKGPASTADVLIALAMDNLSQDSKQTRSILEEQVASWTEQHAKPLVIGSRASFVRYGGGLAISGPPIEYGRSAFELALKRLGNVHYAPEGGSITLDSYDISMRLSALDLRGIRLPTIYREAARSSGNLYR